MRGANATTAAWRAGAEVHLIGAAGADDTGASALKELQDEVFNPGGGDTFNGWLAARLAAGDGFLVAARLAVVAASRSVEHLGARDGVSRAGGQLAGLATTDPET